MIRKYSVAKLTFLFTAFLFIFNIAYAQRERLITIESIVKDDNGNPIENVEVFSNTSYTKTDESGKFLIGVEPNSKVVFEFPGYEKRSIPVDMIRNMSEIQLNATEFYYGSDDEIQIAFRRVKRGDVVSAVSVVNTSSIEDYDNKIMANDILNGRTLGLLGSNSVRGIGIGIDVASLTGSGLRSGNALFIVDGLPRNIDYLRATEIESITVLKDANAAVLYGSAAVNGVILITTKRGEAYKNNSKISASYGISTPRELPKFLNSADYMTYFDQARLNDGRDALYGEETIKNYRTGNKYRYPDIDYYSDEYVNSLKNYMYLNGEFSGGNDNAKYYLNTGWNSYGSYYNFGEGANARNNMFNARGNVDLKVNDWIKTSIDGSGVFVINKYPRGNYWADAASIRPHEYSPLLPIDLINPENSLLIGRKNDIDGKYLLGGNSNFITTPFGNSYSAGEVERIERNFSFNNRVDFDLNNMVQGLSFHTNISFDYFMRFDQTIANTYSVYEPVWDKDNDLIIDLKQHGVDAKPGTQVVGNTYFRRRFGFYGLFSYDRMFNDVHHVTGSLMGYGNNFKQQGDFQGVKQAHLGLQLGYTFNRKYGVDFSSAYVNSVKLPQGNRGGFSPTLGLSWLVSSEDFMQSADNVDVLKLRLSGGIINSDLPIGGFFYYDSRYTTSGSYNWIEGTRSRSGVMSSWSNNSNLGFAKRNNINLGLEGLFFNRLFGFEANFFYDYYSDLISRPSTIYPSFYNDFIPYENFGADEYMGIEAGITLNKSVGDWSFFGGLNLLYVTSERVKVDEVYDNDYQYRKGHPRDATFGLEAIGLFSDQNEIDNSPIQTFGDVKPGDIKYKDQNGDGIIDGNDEVYLRRWQAPLSGGLQLRISYKNLTLYALGEGRKGDETFMEGDYYWIDGNKKYTEVVLDSWTPETKNSATYPRLSSVTNSNNNRRSSYWLYENDYFQIRKVQLSYKLPQSFSKSLLMKHLDVFVDASDLYQFSKNRKIRDLRVGNEPYSRTFSIGIKANF